MPDVFISYAREDLETAHLLAEGLGQLRMDVWWDRRLGLGGDFAREIETQLHDSKVVVVLWSVASVASDFVRDEAERARKMGKLLPVRIDGVQLPLGFGTLHTLDLNQADEPADDPAWPDFLTQLRGRLSVPAGRPAQEPVPAGRRTWTRRQTLVSFGALGGAGLGTGLWLWRDHEGAGRRRQAIERLDKALEDHFAPEPRLEGAQAAYADALRLDPTLARAHYFLAHLYVQSMRLGNPPPEDALLQTLRAEAREHFRQALNLAGSDSLRLDASQRLIAGRQLAQLQEQDAEAPPALARAPKEAAPGTAFADAPAAGTPPAASPPASPAPARAAAARPRPVEPPRVPAPPATVAQARQLAQQLFDENRDTRLAAASALTLDPALAAEALPAALKQAEALRAPATDASAREGLRATLDLTGRASPSTLRRSAPTLERLLPGVMLQTPGPVAGQARSIESTLSLQRPRPPVAYIQIADESQRALATRLAQRLRASGYEVPEVERVGDQRAPARAAMRAQGGSDPDLGRWCRQVMQELIGEPVDYQTLRQARPATDTYELWFDRGLCRTDARMRPACSATT